MERHLKARKTQWYNPFAFLVEDEFFLGELHVGNTTEASFAGLEKLIANRAKQQIKEYQEQMPRRAFLCFPGENGLLTEHKKHYRTLG